MPAETPASSPGGLTSPMLRLLRCARRDACEARSCVLDHLGDGGVLIVDESGFLRAGLPPGGPMAAVRRHRGGIGNAKVGVFLANAAAHNGR
ncbi:hypothetical protein [Streptomyces sp. NPDC086010]|uniref:hypothetical protein n=1 Tax=Streptomyces sp. NPDC086010 TaxID=3365745 RepID=UPI0037D389C1